MVEIGAIQRAEGARAVAAPLWQLLCDYQCKCDGAKPANVVLNFNFDVVRARRDLRGIDVNPTFLDQVAYSWRQIDRRFLQISS